MNVLSLFDGISCGQIALNKAKVGYDTYFSSEIDKDAINVAMSNYPNTKQLGGVQSVTWFGMPRIDLLIGGSPCQDISNLNKFRLGLDGNKSSLFYHWYRLKRDLSPKYFLLENVVGKVSAINKITDLLEVEPLMINSLDFLPHSRKRLYWTNIPVEKHKPNTSCVSDLMQDVFDDKYYQTTSWNKWWNVNKDFQIAKHYSTLDAKRAACLTARMYASWNGNFLTAAKGIRRYTPIECERLQAVPDNYTSIATDTQRYKMLGNGWTVDVIAHIFKGLL